MRKNHTVKPKIPIHITIRQIPIRTVKGIVVGREYKGREKFIAHDSIIAIPYKSLEDRRKIYNQMRYQYKYNLISFIPD